MAREQNNSKFEANLKKYSKCETKTNSVNMKEFSVDSEFFNFGYHEEMKKTLISSKKAEYSPPQCVSLHLPAESHRKKHYYAPLETIDECEIYGYSDMSNSYSSSTISSDTSAHSHDDGEKDKFFPNWTAEKEDIDTLYQIEDWTCEEEEEEEEPTHEAPFIDEEMFKFHTTNKRVANEKLGIGEKIKRSSHIPTASTEAVSSSVALLKYACRNRQYEKSLKEKHQPDSPGGDGKSDTHPQIDRKSIPPICGAPEELPQIFRENIPPIESIDVVRKNSKASSSDENKDSASAIAIARKGSLMNIRTHKLDSSYIADKDICKFSDTRSEVELLRQDSQTTLNLISLSGDNKKEHLSEIESKPELTPPGVNNIISVLINKMTDKINRVINVKDFNYTQFDQKQRKIQEHQKKSHNGKQDEGVNVINFPKRCNSDNIGNFPNNQQYKNNEILEELIHLVTTTISQLKLITEGKIMSHTSLNDCSTVLINTSVGPATATILTRDDFFKSPNNVISNSTEYGSESFLNFDSMYRNIYMAEAKFQNSETLAESENRPTCDPKNFSFNKIGQEFGDYFRTRSHPNTNFKPPDDLISFDDNSVLPGHYAAVDETRRSSSPSLLDTPFKDITPLLASPQTTSILQMLRTATTSSSIPTGDSILRSRCTGPPVEVVNHGHGVIEIVERCPDIRNLAASVQQSSPGYELRSLPATKERTIECYSESKKMPYSVTQHLNHNSSELSMPASSVTSSNILISRQLQFCLLSERPPTERLGSDSAPVLLNPGNSVYVGCLEELKDCVYDPNQYLQRCIAVSSAKNNSDKNDNFSHIGDRESSLIRGDNTSNVSKPALNRPSQSKESTNYAEGNSGRGDKVKTSMSNLTHNKHNYVNTVTKKSSKSETSETQSSEIKDGVPKVLLIPSQSKGTCNQKCKTVVKSNDNEGSEKNLVPVLRKENCDKSSSSAGNQSSMNDKTSRLISEDEIIQWLHDSQEDANIEQKENEFRQLLKGYKRRKSASFSVRRRSARHGRKYRAMKTILERIQSLLQPAGTDLTKPTTSPDLIKAVSKPTTSPAKPGVMPHVVLNMLMDSVKEGFMKRMTSYANENELVNIQKSLSAPTPDLMVDMLLDKLNCKDIGSAEVKEIEEIASDKQDKIVGSKLIEKSNSLSFCKDVKNSEVTSSVTTNNKIFSSDTIFSGKSSTLANYLGSETSSEKTEKPHEIRKKRKDDSKVIKKTFPTKRLPTPRLKKLYSSELQSGSSKEAIEIDFGNTPVFDITPDPPTAVSIQLAQAEVSETSFSSKPPPHPRSIKIKDRNKNNLQRSEARTELMTVSGGFQPSVLQNLNEMGTDPLKKYFYEGKGTLNESQRSVQISQYSRQYSYALVGGTEYTSCKSEQVTFPPQNTNNAQNSMKWVRYTPPNVHGGSLDTPKITASEGNDKRIKETQLKGPKSGRSWKTPENFFKDLRYTEKYRKNKCNGRCSYHDSRLYGRPCSPCRKNKAESLSANYMETILGDVIKKFVNKKRLRNTTNSKSQPYTRFRSNNMFKNSMEYYMKSNRPKNATCTQSSVMNKTYGRPGFSIQRPFPGQRSCTLQQPYTPPRQAPQRPHMPQRSFTIQRPVTAQRSMPQPPSTIQKASSTPQRLKTQPNKRSSAQSSLQVKPNTEISSSLKQCHKKTDPTTTIPEKNNTAALSSSAENHPEHNKQVITSNPKEQTKQARARVIKRPESAPRCRCPKAHNRISALALPTTRYIEETRDRFRSVLSQDQLEHLDMMLIRRMSEESNAKMHYRGECATMSSSSSYQDIFSTSSWITDDDPDKVPEKERTSDQEISQILEMLKNIDSDDTEILQEISHDDVDTVVLGGYVFVGTDALSTESKVERCSANADTSLSSYEYDQNRYSSCGINKIALNLRRTQTDKNVRSMDKYVPHRAAPLKYDEHLKTNSENSQSDNIIAPRNITYRFDEPPMEESSTMPSTTNYAKLSSAHRDSYTFGDKSHKLLEDNILSNMPSIAVHRAVTLHQQNMSEVDEIYNKNKIRRKFPTKLNKEAYKMEESLSTDHNIAFNSLSHKMQESSESQGFRDDSSYTNTSLIDSRLSLHERLKERYIKAVFKKFENMLDDTYVSDFSDSDSSYIHSIPSYSEVLSSAGFNSSRSNTEQSLELVSKNESSEKLKDKDNQSRLPKRLVSTEVKTVETKMSTLRKTNGDTVMEVTSREQSHESGFLQNYNKSVNKDNKRYKHLVSLQIDRKGEIQALSKQSSRKNVIEIKISCDDNNINISLFSQQNQVGSSKEKLNIEPKVIFDSKEPIGRIIQHTCSIANSWNISEAKVVSLAVEKLLKIDLELVRHFDASEFDFVDIDKPITYPFEMFEECEASQIIYIENPVPPLKTEYVDNPVLEPLECNEDYSNIQQTKFNDINNSEVLTQNLCPSIGDVESAKEDSDSSLSVLPIDLSLELISSVQEFTELSKLAYINTVIGSTLVQSLELSSGAHELMQNTDLPIKDLSHQTYEWSLECASYLKEIVETLHVSEEDRSSSDNIKSGKSKTSVQLARYQSDVSRLEKNNSLPTEEPALVNKFEINDCFSQMQGSSHEIVAAEMADVEEVSCCEKANVMPPVGPEDVLFMQKKSVAEIPSYAESEGSSINGLLIQETIDTSLPEKTLDVICVQDSEHHEISVHDLTSPDTVKDILAAFSHAPNESAITSTSIHGSTLVEPNQNSPATSNLDDLLEALANLNSCVTAEEESFRTDLSSLEEFLEQMSLVSAMETFSEETGHDHIICVKDNAQETKVSEIPRTFETIEEQKVLTQIIGAENYLTVRQEERCILEYVGTGENIILGEQEIISASDEVGQNQEENTCAKVERHGSSINVDFEPNLLRESEDISDSTSDDTSIKALQDEILENYVPDEETKLILHNILNDVLQDVVICDDSTEIPEQRKSEIVGSDTEADTEDTLTGLFPTSLENKRAPIKDVVDRIRNTLNMDEGMRTKINILDNIVRLDLNTTHRLVRKMTTELALIPREEMELFMAQVLGMDSNEFSLDSVYNNLCNIDKLDTPESTESKEVNHSELSDTNNTFDELDKEISQMEQMLEFVQENSVELADELTECFINKVMENMVPVRTSKLLLGSDSPSLDQSTHSGTRSVTGSEDTEWSELYHDSLEDINASSAFAAFDPVSNEVSDSVDDKMDSTVLDAAIEENIMMLHSVLDEEGQLLSGAGDGAITPRTLLQTGESQITWAVLSLEDMIRSGQQHHPLNIQSSSLSVVVSNSVADNTTISSHSSSTQTADFKSCEEIPVNNSPSILESLEEELSVSSCDNCPPMRRNSVPLKSSGRKQKNLDSDKPSCSGLQNTKANDSAKAKPKQTNNVTLSRHTKAFATVYFILFSLIFGSLTFQPSF